MTHRPEPFTDCTWRPEHDPVSDTPMGPKCDQLATHVIYWLDGTGRYSLACDDHLELDPDAPPHRLYKIEVGVSA